MGDKTEDEQQPERVCECSHSAAAHGFLLSGRCSFCACQELELRDAEKDAADARADLARANYSVLVKEAKEKLRRARRARK